MLFHKPIRKNPIHLYFLGEEILKMPESYFLLIISLGFGQRSLIIILMNTAYDR